MLLVGLDVESLYSSIPHDLGLQAIRYFLNELDLDQHNFNLFILKLLQFVLTHNFFLFNGQLYHQIQGTAMGTTCAPSYAKLYLGRWEREVWSGDEFADYLCHVPTWHRYIDDIFLLWTGPLSTLNEFISILNCNNKNLKFTYEWSDTQLNFLDLTIRVDKDGHIYTDFFRKRSAANPILQATSSHPGHLLNSIPYGQYVRARRNCTTETDFQQASGGIRLRLSRRGYSPKTDPGGCKTTFKKINREKDVEMKWEQFILPGKGKRQGPILHRGLFPRARKLSFLSISRYSGLSSTVTPTIGSVSSLLQSSDEIPASLDGPQDSGEDIESTINSSFHTPGRLSKEEDEEPLSDYLQSLLRLIAESVTKELDEEESLGKYKIKSSPPSVTSPTSLFIKKKSNMLSEMRGMFFEVADEADMYLHDKVEAMERRRQENNIQKYKSLESIQNFYQDLNKMRKAYQCVKEEKNYTDTKNWYVILLSKIPESVKNNQKIKKILEKLANLEEKTSIRIRPHSFLKVLNGLRNWELCSPDISVAIEFVREYLVQMPFEDYITWLQTRLSSYPSNRAQSAPPQR
ncbi:coiled-coil domain-containing protein 60 [Gastrophryne carolinensis]